MKRTFIIAEAGVNHNGDIKLAKKLIDCAVNAGVDAIKFQTFKADRLVTVNASKAEYQKETTGNSETQYEMLKKLELSYEDHRELLSYCKTKNIQFCSSPFDLESIDFLKELNVPFWKIPSGEIQNLPYLRKIAQYNEKVILSSGMSTLEDIERALSVLTENGTSKNQITVLHCHTAYPTKPEDCNLLAMDTIQNQFGIDVGYSDHTLGIEIPIAAVAMGASIIEKHITLDKEMSGPDHRASLNPGELALMVKSIRNIEAALGNAEKKPSETEYKNLAVARKSIVANQNIKSGEMFSSSNLTIKRPGLGRSPMEWDDVIGTTSDNDYNEGDYIK